MAYEILTGDCREVLKTLPDNHFHTCVTSPPYFGLRDYGVDGQVGLEKTPEDFVNELVDVLRGVRRVLRDDGTLWLNLGDTYNNNPSTSQIPKREQGNGSGAFQIPGEHQIQARPARPNKAQPLIEQGIKKKDLIGIPWRVAFALQNDGWYLRQDIIWHKPNPMPESVRDRCTKSHEYIFLLSKSPQYFFDNGAIKEPSVTNDKRRPHGRGQESVGGRPASGARGDSPTHDPSKRNRRSVWTVTTKPFKGAHFATFPPELIEPCILAGCPEGGNVLDPFNGAGTTGLVSLKHNRNYVGIELNPEYAEMSEHRLREVVGH